MESSDWAQASLDAVEQERAESARRYVAPRGYDALMGAAVALLVLGLSLNTGDVATQVWAGPTIVGVGLLLWQIRRFIAANGAWISSLIAGPTRWVAASGIALEVAGFAVAIYAGSRQQWLLVVLVSVVTGALVGWTSHRWSAVYRRSLGG
ncbi:MAG: hypothetical protein WKF50_10150 [Nocardioides sp.]